ncbi:hypothetical protein JY404_00220 [Stenotrophomonas maltophilia]|uniref:hypothetical protein n=1 Tax=Stenotrophomonas sp. 232 TaxID=2785387 RepID=UPI0018AD4728|nr:hypothetical protein [Stenotrophomonas sp. 232]MBF9137529.1 hypothetical protein [Stenotrophomonas sp. 232]MBN4972866.1 hypothetical protein [Stenotrophomonas maltophilia]
MNDVNKACSCPSGDGSLRHPCSAHSPRADVQPGGTVRLATVPYDRARDLLGDAYNAGTHGIGYSQQTMELHEAIIPAQPSPGGQGAPRCAEHCQNGFADICLASQRDGVICPEDSCDIDDGIRHNHLAASQPVAGLSWADYWIERGQPDVAHDFDAFSRAEAWALQRFPYAGQPVGQLTDAEIDARLNPLYRDLVASGQHNGGMSGVAWDRAVYRMASNQSSGNPGELAVDGARQPVAEPVTVEAVATVRRNGDGDRYIDWLTEGGIADLEVGDVLMVSDRAITDEDGSGEVYTAAPAQAVDLEQFRPAVCALGLHADEPEDVDEAKRLLALIDSQAAVK